MQNLAITLTAVDVLFLILSYTEALPVTLLFYLIMVLGIIIPILWAQIVWNKSKKIWKLLLSVAVIFPAIYLWEYLVVGHNVESFGDAGLGVVYLLQIVTIILATVIQIILLRIRLWSSQNK